MAPPSTEGLAYSEFGTWYDAHSVEVLEPALESAWTALDATLTDVLSDRDLARIRSTAGRVKSKRRTWRKVQQPRFADLIAGTDDIPTVIHDLVGLRITCTNVRDIDMVQATLETLPRSRPKKGGLWLVPGSERDYIAEPKDSGYRGWHIGLGIVIDSEGKRVPVTCELQVRTLLQDTWGELTHEDTYSKDGALPPLVEVLSKRIADLFATLDDIAEDLRTELDRIELEAVTETSGADESAEQAALSGVAADAAEMLVARWNSLDRPTDLAGLAWELQREFGAEISDGWFGHRSFKRFLRRAVPDGEISTGRQAYLLPPTGSTDAGPEYPEASTVPEAAQRLHRADRSFPLLEAPEWPPVFSALAEAWRRTGTRKPNTRLVNQLTRSARDREEAAGRTLSRRHLDHVAKSVMATSDSGEPMDAEDIRETFILLTLQRMADLRVIGPSDAETRAAVRTWLGGG